MPQKYAPLILLLGGCLTYAPAAKAAEASINFRDSVSPTLNLSHTLPSENINKTSGTHEGIKPEARKKSALRHFTWGIDVGASIDLSGEDMSTFTAETYFGYKGSWIRTAALGIGMHKAFANQYTFVPVYGLLRTSFRSKPSLFFFELKAGYSFNTLAHSGSIGGAYGSFGLGVNLAMKRTFQSHIVLAYSYFTLKNATELDIKYSGDNINSAVLRFGVNF